MKKQTNNIILMGSPHGKLCENCYIVFGNTHIEEMTEGPNKTCL